MSNQWSVEVVQSATGKVVRSIQCASENAAERTERGVLVNLNYDEYFTRVVSLESKEATP